MRFYNDRPDAERYRYLRNLAMRSLLESFVALKQLDHLYNSEELDKFLDEEIKKC
jgi:hypothetical protein